MLHSYPANTKLHVTYLLVVINTRIILQYYIFEQEITTNRFVTCNFLTKMKNFINVCYRLHKHLEFIENSETVNRVFIKRKLQHCSV